MKKTIHYLAGAGTLLLAVQLSMAAPVAEKEALDPKLLKLPPPQSAGQYVEVHIRQNLIGLVARAAEAQEPEIASVLRKIKAVHVNVVGVDSGNRREIDSRFQELRESLTKAGWDQVAQVQDGSEKVTVLFKTQGEEAVEGVVVQVISNDAEAVLVSITGDIRPEQVGLIGERFNIEPLKDIGREISGK